MNELDMVIIYFLNKTGIEAKNNIAIIMLMNNKDKLRILNFLANLHSIGIIPSNRRVRRKINEILGGDIK